MTKLYEILALTKYTELEIVAFLSFFIFSVDAYGIISEWTTDCYMENLSGIWDLYFDRWIDENECLLFVTLKGTYLPSMTQWQCLLLWHLLTFQFAPVAFSRVFHFTMIQHSPITHYKICNGWMEFKKKERFIFCQINEERCQFRYQKTLDSIVLIKDCKCHVSTDAIILMLHLNVVFYNVLWLFLLGRKSLHVLDINCNILRYLELYSYCMKIDTFVPLL